MLNKNRVSQILLHGLFLLLAYILQAAVMPYLPVFGVCPVVLPIAAVGTGLFEGSFRGGIFGLIAGMLCDVSFNMPTVLFTVVLTIVGIITGVLAESIMARGFPSYFLCSLGALLLVGFCQCFSLIFFRDASAVTVVITLAGQTLYSIIFTIPFYFVSRAIGRGVLA